ncbi:MAG: SlyX family protein [Pseudomonadota bacterium]
MNDDLIELQTQLAFQEHTVAELNQVLINQQKQMDVLREEVRLLKDKLVGLEDRVEQGVVSASEQHERPPHY